MYKMGDQFTTFAVPLRRIFTGGGLVRGEEGGGGGRGGSAPSQKGRKREALLLLLPPLNASVDFVGCCNCKLEAPQLRRAEEIKPQLPTQQISSTRRTCRTWLHVSKSERAVDGKWRRDSDI